jgi:hypothetical protein
MKSGWGVAFVTIGVHTSVSLAAPHAHAQDVSAVFYEDARDTIQDVLTDELSRSVARFGACSSPDGLLVYYESTLQALQETRYDVLRETLRADGARLLGSYVYRAVNSGSLSVSDLVPFAFAGTAAEVQAAQTCSNDWEGKIGSPARYLKQRRAADPAHPSVALATCDDSPKTTLRETFACDVGLGTEALVLDRQAEGRARLLQATGTAVAYVLVPSGNAATPEFQAARTLISEWLTRAVDDALEDGQPNIWDIELSAPGAVLPAAFDGDARSMAQEAYLLALTLLSQKTPELFTVAGTPVPWSNVMATFATEKQFDAAQLLRKLAGAGPNDGVSVAAFANGRFQVTLTADGSVSGAGLLQLDILPLVARLYEQLAPLRPIVHRQPSNWARVARVLSQTSRLAREWRALEKQGFPARGVSRLLDHSLAFVAREGACVDGSTVPGCVTIANMRSIATNAQLLEALNSARSGKGGKAAVKALEGALTLAESSLARVAKDECTSALIGYEKGAGSRWTDTDKGAICPKLDDSHDGLRTQLGKLRPVMLALASYWVDADKAVADEKRAALKEAMQHWLTSGLAKNNGYIDGNNGEWLAASLGASWSAGYVDRQSNGVRFPAALDALIAIVPLKNDPYLYLGLQGSLLNLLGPFAEIALRDPDISYRTNGRLWANLVQPRVDVMFGVPYFSKSVAVYAGISGRPAPVFPTEGSKTTYVYALPWQKDEVDSDIGESSFATRFVEFGAGVRLYPF